MTVEMIGLVVVVVLLVIMFAMMHLREMSMSKKLAKYENTIDEITRQNYMLEKAISELKESGGSGIDSAKNEIDSYVASLLSSELKKAIEPMEITINEIESAMRNFKNTQTYRIDKLEERSDALSYLTTQNSSNKNEEEIINQFKEGYTESEIAKNLQIGLGEIDLVLKLANIKK